MWWVWTSISMQFWQGWTSPLTKYGFFAFAQCHGRCSCLFGFRYKNQRIVSHNWGLSIWWRWFAAFLQWKGRHFFVTWRQNAFCQTKTAFCMNEPKKWPKTKRTNGIRSKMIEKLSKSLFCSTLNFCNNLPAIKPLLCSNFIVKIDQLYFTCGCVWG